MEKGPPRTLFHRTQRPQHVRVTSLPQLLRPFLGQVVGAHQIICGKMMGIVRVQMIDLHKSDRVAQCIDFGDQLLEGGSEDLHVPRLGDQSCCLCR